MVAETHESGGFSGGSNEVGVSSSILNNAAVMDESERGGGGGNRWPRPETLALLKIRSDMDVAFRDSSLKGPLWDEISRKMADLGFQRSAKKCKEKFENVFKYHKRTKDGRQSKPDGKSYRFFDQLEALENTPPLSFTPLPSSAPSTAALPPNPINTQLPINFSSPNPLSVAPPNTTPATQNSNNPIFQSILNPPLAPLMNTSNPPPPPQFQSNSTSSSTSSDKDIQRRIGKKRKLKDFINRMMNDVIQKQEELQKKFLDTLEKREQDRMAREEAWRVREMARMNHEHEILVQERAVAAAKDAAVIAFLQKVTTDQNNLQIPIGNNATLAHVPLQVSPAKNPQPPVPPPPPQQYTPPLPLPPSSQALAIIPVKTLEISKTNNGGDNFNNSAASSSRWPKTEIEALIKLRTDLELKYQDTSPKGPLWEEISSAMAKLGYNRSSKRCKEKWENINKYFKKVKESSKTRPEDSKTCPYFHQLDAIYKEKAKSEVVPSLTITPPGFSNPIVPIMAQPKQPWPLSIRPPPPALDTQNISDDYDEEEEEEEEEEDDGGRFEIVTNKQPSSME